MYLLKASTEKFKPFHSFAGIPPITALSVLIPQLFTWHQPHILFEN